MLSKELTQKPIEELKKLYEDKRKQLEDVYLALAKNKEKNLKKPKYLKKEVARLLTLVSLKKRKNG